MFKKTKAVAPIVSTILLMAVTLFVVSIALSFVNNTLTRREGENDFESAKIFMKNVGLQIDDVAWTKGRVDTVHFTSQYGQVEFLSGDLPESAPLKYTVTYNCLEDGVGISYEENYYSSILMYNLPIDKSFLGEGYDEAIFPINVNSARELKPVASGTTAPVANVFAIQKSNVGADQYLRIVLVPVMRYHEYYVSSSGTTPTVERHMKLYLPELILNVGIPQPKSIIMTGDGIKSTNYNNVISITVKVEFPRTNNPGFPDDHYDNLFFKFNPKEVTIPMSYQYQVETYIGRVKLDYGT